jgi:allantoicase
VVHAVTVDTTHFTGNAPESVELHGATVAGYPPAAGVVEESVAWVPLVPQTPVKADSV